MPNTCKKDYKFSFSEHWLSKYLDLQPAGSYTKKTPLKLHAHNSKVFPRESERAQDTLIVNGLNYLASSTLCFSYHLVGGSSETPPPPATKTTMTTLMNVNLLSFAGNTLFKMSSLMIMDIGRWCCSKSDSSWGGLI